MLGRSRVLQVSYFSQPTSNTCQSTVLKMMATYIEHNEVRANTGLQIITFSPSVKCQESGDCEALPEYNSWDSYLPPAL